MVGIGTRLDDILLEMKTGGAYAAIHRLHDVLEEYKGGATDTDWASIVKECRSHDLLGLVLRCPITQRSYSKPRGYQGDAELLDLIYEYGVSKPDDEIGEQARKANLATPAARGVKYRRSLIADRIGRVTAAKQKPRILSVASGHLREIELCTRSQLDNISEWIALDQDELSLSEVGKCYSYSNVRPYHGTIKSLLNKPSEFGKFDLIYAAGLFDYLKSSTARRLTKALFEMLAPGGSVLVGNYLKELPDIGYMEVFMDWHLEYRTIKDIEAFGSGVAPDEILSHRVFCDNDLAIGYLEMCRK